MTTENILDFYLQDDSDPSEEVNFKSAEEVTRNYIRNTVNSTDKKKKISISIDTDLYEKISEKARKDRRSFSSLLCQCSEIGFDSLEDTLGI